MKISDFGKGGPLRTAAASLLTALTLVVFSTGFCQAQEPVDRKWGVGWDQGLTLRTWLGGRWEIAIAAGPDDYLSKEETRSWLVSDPPSQQGIPEVPEDIREEHGWVRLQLGRLIKRHGDFAVAGYGGVVYEWIVHQERTLVLQELNNGYDSFELDRNTERWVMTLGLRPSWQPTSFLTIETAFGLNFIVDNWDQTTNRTWTGGDGSDHQELEGHGQKFQDFGFEGAASVQIFIWL